jgi:DNA-binding transcriptional regulator YhcF (GntR family)
VKSTRGKRRVLNDAQVQRILRWNLQVQEWNEKRMKVPTLRAFARANGIDPRTVTRQLPGLDRKIELLMRIRRWHRALSELLEARAQLDTLRGLAREFRVSDNTIQSVIRRRGEYKQASPELLDEARAQRRVRLERLTRMNLY